jgi:hypothetical protein
MKNRILSFLFGAHSFALLLVVFVFLFVGCGSIAQDEASGAYIAAEAGTTALLQKGTITVVEVNLITGDWAKFQAGTIQSSDEITLLQTVVKATKGKLNAVDASILDGASQQIVANQNKLAPTPLQGAAAAIIQTVLNGAARAAAIYVPPAAMRCTPMVKYVSPLRS